MTMTDFFNNATLSHTCSEVNDELYLKMEEPSQKDAHESGEQPCHYFPFQGKTDKVLARQKSLHMHLLHWSNFFFSNKKKFSGEVVPAYSPL